MALESYYKKDHTKRIYLACPYQHEDPEVREERYQKVTRKTADLMHVGHQVFSPITHSHPVSLHLPHPQGHDFWMEQDYPYIEHWATELWVYALDGWKESKGVWLEVDFALTFSMPIRIVP